MSRRRLGWGVTLGLLPVLVVASTGIWLAWSTLFLPADLGRQSMADLERSVLLGQFVRAIHKWGAYGTLVSVVVWSLKALQRSRLAAVMGVLLSAVVLLEFITGLWLPWDKMALWVLGRSYPALSLIGSQAFSGWLTVDILWWYGLHLVLLPLVGVGLALAVRRGTRSDPVTPEE